MTYIMLMTYMIYIMLMTYIMLKSDSKECFVMKHFISKVIFPSTATSERSVKR